MKPIAPKRVLHPALAAHGQKVKAAHAHLTVNAPGFKELHPHDRTRLVQAHIKKGGAC